MNHAPGDEKMAAWLEAAWMARYLERGLDPDETAWFEAYVLDKPHLIAAIERDSDLRDAVHAADLGQALPVSNEDSSAVPEPARRRVLPLAMAASVVAGLLGIRIGQSLLDEPPQVAVDPMLLHIETMRDGQSGARIDGGDPRSASAILEIVLPPGTRRAEARIGDLHVDRQVAGESLLTVVLPLAELRRATVLELVLYVEDAQERRSIVLPSLPVPEKAP